VAGSHEQAGERPYGCSVVSRGMFTVASAIDAQAVPAVALPRKDHWAIIATAEGILA